MDTPSASTSFKDSAVHVSAAKDDVFKPLAYKPVSSDSHVTEPPNCYIDYIDPKFYTQWRQMNGRASSDS